jgi:hypothetical protein
MMLTLCGPLAERCSWASGVGKWPAQRCGVGGGSLTSPTPGATGRPAWATGNQARGLALK